jgi:hypothetical protein
MLSSNMLLLNLILLIDLTFSTPTGFFNNKPSAKLFILTNWIENGIIRPREAPYLFLFSITKIRITNWKAGDVKKCYRK